MDDEKKEEPAATVAPTGVDDELLTEFISVMNHVYGEFSTKTDWIPKAYKDSQPRYLWTDAFGVVNYLTLYVYTKDEQYLTQAILLVNHVHDILGKTRDGKKRIGNASAEHPILNGLRIGKLEDESSSMEGDGQYWHYNTKWMFALNRLSVITGDPKYNQWAVEMAKNTFPKFVNCQNKHYPRMYWKLNIDLSKILVNSEGNLDPLDGYITYKLLEEENKLKDSINLQDEIAVFKTMVDRKVPYYNSDDTLDLGEACWIAHWFLSDEAWARRIAQKSLKNLNELNEKGILSNQLPVSYRLAFREFGTAIGTQCLYYSSDKVRSVAELSKPWQQEIVPNLLKFWKKNIYKRDKDITPVMYCSSLIPGVWCRNFKQMLKK